MSEFFSQFFGNILATLKKCAVRAVRRSVLCRSRREASNEFKEHSLASIGSDTAENEPGKVCRTLTAGSCISPLLRSRASYPTGGSRARTRSRSSSACPRCRPWATCRRRRRTRLARVSSNSSLRGLDPKFGLSLSEDGFSSNCLSFI